LFNPKSYAITKSVTWGPQPSTDQGTGKTAATDKNKQTHRALDAPPMVFNGGGARDLSLELFFDVTDGGPTADVRSETNKLVALTRTDRALKTKPPICQLSWGEAGPDGSDFVESQWVVTKLIQSFVMFRASGVPVRANLTVSFSEYIDPELNKRKND